MVTKTPGPRHLSMITSIGREVFQVNNFVKIRLVTSGTSIIMFLLNITDKSVTASHSIAVATVIGGIGGGGVDICL